MSDFLRKVPIGPNDFQIGVITYNFKPVILFDLDDHSNMSGILADLQTVKGEDAPTYTTPALQKAKQVFSFVREVP